MEQTEKGKIFLQADKTTPEADEAKFEKMGAVLNLLHDRIVRAMRLMWCQLFFTGVLIILLFIAYFSLLSKTPSISNVAAPGPELMEKFLPTSEIDISSHVPQTQQSIRSTPFPKWEEVRDILNQVREAQLKKDINLFLNAYSPTFPNLAEKKESLLKSWQKYDYCNMNFSIENIYRQNTHSIIATVVWDITLEDIRSKKKSKLLQDYNIHFSDVSGKWLIQGLTQGEKKQTRSQG